MEPILSIRGLSKTYKSGLSALKNIDLDIQRGELFALLGPNGAGKTTMISAITGIINPSGGKVMVNGYDIEKNYRQCRRQIGLVPQELATDSFETVLDTINFSRGLFGKPKNPDLVKKLLNQLSLWEKRDSQIRALSGGMKRRVLIAKALCHEPEILFLDEPTAGVDVELRRDMWEMVAELKQQGTTIVLTTHYIEEAEQMADRIGVINSGELMLVEDKVTLMERLGQRQLRVLLQAPLTDLPPALSPFNLELEGEGEQLVFTYSSCENDTGVLADLLKSITDVGLHVKDIHTSESSLEEIFVNLVREQ